MQGEGMKNHTEFIAKAVDFYLGYLNSRDSTGYLSEHILSAIGGTLKNSENRISANLFRLSVEMALMINVLCLAIDGIDEDWLADTRANCVRDIKKSKGKVLFENILEQKFESDH